MSPVLGPRRRPRRSWPRCAALAAEHARLGRPHELAARARAARRSSRRSRADGHEVEVTARDFAQTLELRERYGLAHTADRHPPRRARSAPRRAAWSSRSVALTRWARRRPRGSTSPSGTARTTSPSPRGCCASRARRCSTTSAPPSSTPINCRLAAGRGRARRHPARAAAALRGRARSSTVSGAEGGVLPEPTSSPTRPSSASSGSTATPPLAVVRTPPAVSLYHRFENPLFAAVLDAAARAGPGRRAARGRRSSGPSWPAWAGSSSPSRRSTPRRSSRFADLVISAGGTMNREAVALGTPVWTVFEGRLGAVDERAHRRGPAAPAHPASEVAVARRDAGGPSAERIRRDPRVLAGCSSRAR